MGSNINVKCPECGEFGYFYSEKRKETRISIRQIWFQIKKESPSLSNEQIKLKIYTDHLIVVKNIPHKEKYQSEFRRGRKPLFYVVHNIEKSGKPKTRKCYLGIFETAKSKLVNSINNCKHNHLKLQDPCECGAFLHNGIVYHLDLLQFLSKKLTKFEE